MARHINEVQQGRLDSVMFRGIELVRPSRKGEDWDAFIFQKESRWIHRMQSIHQSGLNEQLTSNLFFLCFCCILLIKKPASIRSV